MIQPSRLPRYVALAALTELLRRQQRFADAVLEPDLGGPPPGKAKRARLARARASKRECISTGDTRKIGEHFPQVNVVTSQEIAA
jgi:hypothetical protein